MHSFADAKVTLGKVAEALAVRAAEDQADALTAIERNASVNAPLWTESITAEGFAHSDIFRAAIQGKTNFLLVHVNKTANDIALLPTTSPFRCRTVPSITSPSVKSPRAGSIAAAISSVGTAVSGEGGICPTNLQTVGCDKLRFVVPFSGSERYPLRCHCRKSSSRETRYY